MGKQNNGRALPQRGGRRPEVRTRTLMAVGILIVASVLVAGEEDAGAMCCPVPCGIECSLESAAQANFVKMDRQAGIVHLVPNIVLQGMSPDFALVVPTPSEPEFEPVDRALWTEARTMTRSVTRVDEGGGCANDRVAFLSAPGGDPATDGESVIVHRTHAVGAFEVTVVSSDDPDALVAWLTEHGFPLAPADAAKFRPYVDRAWFFTAMKLDRSRPESEMPLNGWNSEVNPVEIRYASPELELALPIMSINRSSFMPVVVYVVDDHRMALEGFTTLYANRLSRAEYRAVQSTFPNVAPFLRTGRTFTVLGRSFNEVDAMDRSVFLERATTDAEVRGGVVPPREGRIGLEWLLMLLLAPVVAGRQWRCA